MSRAAGAVLLQLQKRKELLPRQRQRRGDRTDRKCFCSASTIKKQKRPGADSADAADAGDGRLPILLHLAFPRYDNEELKWVCVCVPVWKWPSRLVDSLSLSLLSPFFPSQMWPIKCILIYYLQLVLANKPFFPFSNGCKVCRGWAFLLIPLGSSEEVARASAQFKLPFTLQLCNCLSVSAASVVCLRHYRNG